MFRPVTRHKEEQPKSGALEIGKRPGVEQCLGFVAEKAVFNQRLAHLRPQFCRVGRAEFADVESSGCRKDDFFRISAQSDSCERDRKSTRLNSSHVKISY